MHECLHYKTINIFSAELIKQINWYQIYYVLTFFISVFFGFTTTTSSSSWLPYLYPETKILETESIYFAIQYVIHKQLIIFPLCCWIISDSVLNTNQSINQSSFFCWERCGSSNWRSFVWLRRLSNCFCLYTPWISYRTVIISTNSHHLSIDKSLLSSIKLWASAKYNHLFMPCFHYTWEESQGRWF